VGSRYKVLAASGETIDCVLRGKLRVKGVETTNPVAVGDTVVYELIDDGKSGLITEVLERHNYILRKSSNLSKQSQIIAANLDQALLVVTIILPKTQAEFIDRFLATAEAYRIPAVIIFNKTDLYGREEKAKMEELIILYEDVGDKCLRLSLRDGSGIPELIGIIKGKTSLISGNSGVGKSTLLNILNPDLKLRTEEISDYHKQGKHITTFPEMHPLPFGGFAIDTPGIRGFGVVIWKGTRYIIFFLRYSGFHHDAGSTTVFISTNPDALSGWQWKTAK